MEIWRVTIVEIIDGKAHAKALRIKIKEEVSALKEKGVQPGLAVVLVGNDPASEIYVANKEKGCAEAGIYSEKYLLPETATEEEVIALVEKLNADEKIDGILVQLPLPKHIDETKVIETISVHKDVDGFCTETLGQLFLGHPSFEPCTPKGCMYLLEESGCEIKGKKAVVIGRSHIVGKPIAMMLLAKHATVTICHSRTQDLPKELADADIVVVSVGKAKFIKPEWIKDGAYIIDVGINRNEAGKVCGDVDFEAFTAVNKDCHITPVPGGVGPMTITMLLQNTLESAKRRL